MVWILLGIFLFSIDGRFFPSLCEIIQVMVLQEVRLHDEKTGRNPVDRRYLYNSRFFDLQLDFAYKRNFCGLSVS